MSTHRPLANLTVYNTDDLERLLALRHYMNTLVIKQGKDGEQFTKMRYVEERTVLTLAPPEYMYGTDVPSILLASTEQFLCDAALQSILKHFRGHSEVVEMPTTRVRIMTDKVEIRESQRRGRLIEQEVMLGNAIRETDDLVDRLTKLRDRIGRAEKRVQRCRERIAKLRKT